MKAKSRTRAFIELDERYGAHNYHPLPVVIERGKGVFVWDVEGRRYFDMLSAYSALNQGHCHPKIAAAAKAQLGKLALTSRAFHNTLMGPFLKKLCELAKQDMALPMNSGAEAVETAVKAMRQWGYLKKGIPRGRAEIIVCRGNFHGRTTTIVGFSSDPDSYENFGPATPGFVSVNYGSLEDLAAAITPNTCGFLVEPIQGEAGVLVPPAGYLSAARALCAQRGMLFCADEIQTGLGRTGRMFACEHEAVKPDLMILGKALSGGFYPISAVAGSAEVLGLFKPGTHGSTFGGNPLACAIGMAALDVLVRERLPANAAKLGERFRAGLAALRSPLVADIRGKGLLTGVELRMPARPYCERLLEEGVLAKDSHERTIRFAPPLTITKSQLDAALGVIGRVLSRPLP